MGVPGIGICESSGKGRKTTQYAPSTVKDLTSARTQNVLSSSNMAKPIKSSSRKTGMVMWSIKVVEDAPSLFPVLLEVHGVSARPSRGSCWLRRYTHTCQTKRRVPLPSVVEQSLQRNPNLKPSEVVRQSILEGLKTDVVNWHELEKTTDSLLDTNIKFQIWKLKSASNPAGHSFEVVAHLKQKSRREDEFYVYKMNDRHINPDKPCLTWYYNNCVHSDLKLRRDSAWP